MVTTYQKQSKVGVTSCGVDTMWGATATPKINAKPWHQRQGDWEHSKVLSLIQCKKLEHIATKELVKLHSHMVLTTQKWDKIVDEL
jgi:hypothetical protein